MPRRLPDHCFVTLNWGGRVLACLLQRARAMSETPPTAPLDLSAIEGLDSGSPFVRDPRRLTGHAADHACRRCKGFSARCPPRATAARATARLADPHDRILRDRYRRPAARAGDRAREDRRPHHGTFGQRLITVGAQ